MTDHALTDALQKVLVAWGAQDVREAALQRIPARRKVMGGGATASPRGLGFLGINKHAARQQRLQHVVTGNDVPFAEQQIALRVTHALAAAAPLRNWPRMSVSGISFIGRPARAPNWRRARV